MESSSNNLSGTKLRDLRKERALSIEALALMADLTPVALSNIELKSAAPQRSTIIKLLDSLESIQPIPINKRREIVDSFGYTDVPGLPNQHDIDRAVEAWREPFKNAPYPAYIVDYAQRIHDWNEQIIVFLGEDKGSLEGRTVFDLLFHPRSRGVLELVNEEEVAMKMVVHMRQEYKPHMEEEWCRNCLAEARQKYPLFGHLFDSLPDQNLGSIDIRATDPIILRDPLGNLLSFQIVGIDLVSDPRFRVVQYIPMDRLTAQALADIFPASHQSDRRP